MQHEQEEGRGSLMLHMDRWGTFLSVDLDGNRAHLWWLALNGNMMRVVVHSHP